MRLQKDPPPAPDFIHSRKGQRFHFKQYQNHKEGFEFSGYADFGGAWLCATPIKIDADASPRLEKKEEKDTDGAGVDSSVPNSLREG